MACFICKKYGHWAANCPFRKEDSASACNFCGCKGHSASRCDLQLKAKANDAPAPTPSNFADILFQNHIVPQANMKTVVDTFVKTYFKKHGMINEYDLVEHVFNDNMISAADSGHVHVVLYVIAKFCDISRHDEIKDFLKELHSTKGSFDDFKKTLRRWNITPVQAASGKISYRKLTGEIA